MARGRKQSGGRKEPRFGLAAAMADLRLDPKDRIPAGEDLPKKSAAKRKPVEPDDDDDVPAREPKARPSKPAKSGGKSRFGLPF